MMSCLSPSWELSEIALLHGQCRFSSLQQFFSQSDCCTQFRDVRVSTNVLSILKQLGILRISFITDISNLKASIQFNSAKAWTIMKPNSNAERIFSRNLANFNKAPGDVHFCFLIWLNKYSNWSSFSGQIDSSSYHVHFKFAFSAWINLRKGERAF